MIDITCCSGTGCPVKNTCHRYLSGIPDADSNTYIHLRMQSWFLKVPYIHGLKICEYYWDIKKGRKA